ncbi:MAG: hypothetical protein ACOC9R_03990 [bacterium]
MTALTPRELAILRSYGGWMLADILIDPDRGIAHAKQSRYGCTGFRVQGEEFWMQTTPQGIQLSRREANSERRVLEVLRWTKIAQFARALPASLVAELRQHREALTRHNLSAAPFPVRAPNRQQERWHRASNAWLARRRAIEAALDAVLDKAVLGHGGGQAALFDLDAAQSPTSTTGGHQAAAGRTATSPARQERLL